jgi:hypothetical protein
MLLGWPGLGGGGAIWLRVYAMWMDFHSLDRACMVYGKGRGWVLFAVWLGPVAKLECGG